MEKYKNKILWVKNLFKKKRAWAILIIAIIFLVFLFKPSAPSESVVLDTVKYIDLKQTVLATGQVTSSTDLSLSFNTSGTVKSLRVKVGDVVKKGDILATIDQGSVLGSLTSARGALAAAEARLKRIQENEEVALAQVNLDQTKSIQGTLVKNAYHKLLNSTIEAVADYGEDNYTAPVISGSYRLEKEGDIILNTYSERYSSGADITRFKTYGLVDTIGTISVSSPQPIGNSGLYVSFPEDTDLNVSKWIISIPNKNA